MIGAFQVLPSETDQTVIQEKLKTIHEKYGLPAVMDCLFEWELKTGYISREKLDGTERLVFPDKDLQVGFRIQVNYARSRYEPEPLQTSDEPPPHCALCKENIGRPGKEHLRIYEFTLGREDRLFFLQLTPYPLFTHHFILILSEPEPQLINRRSVEDMFGFRKMAPGYTVCSNSDVEWAGASILEHLHYQVFKDLRLPVMEAGRRPGFELELSGCEVDLLNYPLAALRIEGAKPEAVIETASRLIEIWKIADPGRNTANLLLSKEDGYFRFYIFLRNPDYRTPEALRRFKSEGVGIIEAAGECILPAPSGEYAEGAWKVIRESGLELVKGILSGNNPVKDGERIKRIYRELIRSPGAYCP